MARKQLQIKGTERQGHPALEEAGDNHRVALKERKDSTKAHNEKCAGTLGILIATMRSLRVEKYKYDNEDGEEIEITLDEKFVVRIRKTGETDDGIGDEVVESDPVKSDDPSIPKGLIAQALKAQEDAGVAETTDGDVVTPDTASPKGKRTKRSKQSS